MCVYVEERSIDVFLSIGWNLGELVVYCLCCWMNLNEWINEWMNKFWEISKFVWDSKKNKRNKEKN